MNAIYDPPDRVTAWLDRRRTGMFSSDAAAACGLSPWGTPLSVWLSKVEPVAVRTMSPEQRAGLALEPAVARLYELREGVELAIPDDDVRHAEHPWMGSTPDRVRPDGRIVELKTASAYTVGQWGEDGTDEVPEQYLLQVTHQMLVAGVDAADLAALIGGSDFRVYHLRLHPDIAARLVEVEAELWERVRTRKPPEPDWSHPSTAKLIERLYRPTIDDEIALPDEVLPYVEQYQELGLYESETKKERSAVKARIVAALGEHMRGRLSDGTLITRKQIDRAGYTVEPTSYYDMRIKAPKAARKPLAQGAER